MTRALEKMEGRFEAVIDITVRPKRVHVYIYREIVIDEHDNICRPVSMDDPIAMIHPNVREYRPMDIRVIEPPAPEQLRRYWVRLDQRGVFEDLVHVSDAALAALRNAAYREGNEAGLREGFNMGHHDGSRDRRLAMDGMRWWKRIKWAVSPDSLAP